jgi:hypothetical protein
MMKKKTTATTPMKCQTSLQDLGAWSPDGDETPQREKDGGGRYYCAWILYFCMDLDVDLRIPRARKALRHWQAV